MPIKLYNKEDILHSCQSAFAQYGYDGTSTQSLADASGISKALIFHHFGSKKELYFTILTRAVEKYNEEIDLSKIEMTDFFETLTQYMQMKLTYCRYHADDYIFLRSAFLAEQRSLRKETEERFGSITLSDNADLHRLFDQVKLRFAINREEALDLIFTSADGFEQRFIAALTGHKKKDTEYLEVSVKRIANYINMIRYGIE